MLYYFLLLLPCFACLFWTIALLVRKKTNYRSQNIWIVCMISLSISTYIWSIFYAGVEDYITFCKLDSIEGFTTILFFSLVFFYLKAITDKRPFDYKEYLWLLPAILIGGSSVLLCFAMDDKQTTSYMHEIITQKGKVQVFNEPIYQVHYPITTHIYNITISLQIIGIILYAFIHFIKNKKRLNVPFFNSEKEPIGNHRSILIGLFCLLFLSLVTLAGGRYYYNSEVPHTSFLFISFSVIIYYLGYNVYQSKYTIENIADNPKQTNRSTDETEESQNKTNEKISAELIPIFDRIIKEDKIFLQNNLRLDDIARVMRTNRTYISRMINEEYGCSFSDLINRKRIEYAQELMRSNQNLTQEQICEQSGILYPSSFSKIFKQHTGMTFREWQKRNLTS